jgi:hypothetical protein
MRRGRSLRVRIATLPGGYPGLPPRFLFPGQETLDRRPSIVQQALRAQSVGQSGAPHHFEHARVEPDQPQRCFLFAGEVLPLKEQLQCRQPDIGLITLQAPGLAGRVRTALRGRPVSISPGSIRIEFAEISRMKIAIVGGAGGSIHDPQKPKEPPTRKTFRQVSRSGRSSRRRCGAD